MLITTRQKRATFKDDQLQVVMEDTLLPNVESDKRLGATINRILFWEEHIAKHVSIVNKKLAILRRIKNYIPTSARKTFFNAHILPHLDVCSTVWGSSSHVNTLLSVQKRAARIIVDIKDIRAPENRSSILFSQLGWIPCYHRIIFRKATMVYESLNNLTPTYMAKLFKQTTALS